MIDMGGTVTERQKQQQDRTPTESMRVSLLYTLHSHGMNGVHADPNRFREVFASKYGKVRIFKVQS
jgi:hypothetical protein